VTEKAPEDSSNEAQVAAPAAAPQAEPRPPAKRRKKRKVPAPREGVPAFAHGFPRDPDLDRLVDAFERGNYALARSGAERLATETERAEVRRAARELLRRISPEPLATALLLAAAGLLAFLSLWHWSQGYALP
jgi:hypothetical protein